MQRNEHPEFVGIQRIKDRQREQLDQFVAAAKAGDWLAIHEDHYDWWMFPIDEPSAYGYAWTVYEGDIAELRQDPEYLARYLQGVEILATSWGWDLAHACLLPNPQPHQC